MRRIKTFIVTVTLCAGAASASASTITVNDPLWYEFSWNPGAMVTGCDPADTGGLPCVESDGGNSQLAAAPAWTFALAAGGSFEVTDAFIGTDRFEVFDFGVSLGLTSAPSGSASCGSNPVSCLADPLISHGAFSLAGGNHSITIQHSGPTQGAAYFRVLESSALDSREAPEPATLGLMGMGLIGLIARSRRSSRKDS